MSKSVVTFRDLGGTPRLQVTFPKGLSVEDMFPLMEAARGATPQEVARLLAEVGRRTNQMLVVVDLDRRGRRAA